MKIRPLPLSLIVVLALAGACASRPPQLPAPQQIPAPDPADVERVVFLVGDPGVAVRETYPIVQRLEQDIEWWSERLPRDSAVTVLFLGDLIYPLGMHPPGSKEFPHDSAVVTSQVGLVAGRFANEKRAQAYFMAGNHDWGLETDWEGFVRLKVLDDFLDRAKERTGADVQLVPAAGSGGPFVLDLGRHLRVLILDTAWWILESRRDTGAEHAEVLRRIEEAMRTAGGRHVMLAAHHPFKSAGPHGGGFSFWETFGIRYILARSGAILQDLTSRPYRDFERGLRDIFERIGPALLFVGGHEHSLQVVRGTRATDPHYSIVSGSASKLSTIGTEPGMEFGRSAPGYMRLVVAKNGDLSLYVEATDPRYQSCPKEDPQRAECMAAGIAGFETVHSQRIRRVPGRPVEPGR